MDRPARWQSVSLLFGLMWEGKVINIINVVMALLTTATIVQRVLLVQCRVSGVSPEPVFCFAAAPAGCCHAVT
ncbi:MAG TPA: hypothetical protein DIU18_05865 [Gemmatimonadetes bacterium]|nr:hypothetical protein [Gemmatimonadota bacterium]